MLQAEGPGIARGKKNVEKKNFQIFLYPFTPPGSPMSVQKISAHSIQPFGRL